MFNIMNVVKPSSGIQMIHHSQIHTNARNFYEISDLENLKEDIAEHGIRKNLEIYPSSRKSGMYELVDGERRYTAVIQLIKAGRSDLEYIPCLIDENMTEEEAEKRLILANATSRVISPGERLKQVERLKYLYRKEKEAGNLPGRIQQLIADDLGLKKSQVGNYEKILNHAIPEVKQLVEGGELSISAATELSSLEDEDQLMFVDSGQDLDIKTIKEYKEQQLQSKEANECLDNEIEYTKVDDMDDDLEESYDNSKEGYIDDYESEERDIEELQVESASETIESLFQVLDLYSDKLLKKLSIVEFQDEKKELLEILEKMELLKYRLGIGL